MRKSYNDGILESLMVAIKSTRKSKYNLFLLLVAIFEAISIVAILIHLLSR